MNLRNTNADTIYAADLFAGAGGATSALIAAARELGVNVELVAVNHWQKAVNTHKANYPGFVHYCQKVGKVDPQEAVPGGYLDILLAGPECFPEGTLILTEDGLMPIERVRVGTRVLTHRGRWMPVTDTMITTKETVRIKGQGFYGLETTLEHPLLTVQRYHRHRPLNGSRYRYSAPNWVEAGKLDVKRDMWGTPTHFDTLPVPPVGGRGALFTREFWWMVGRWLGDGSLRFRENKAEVTICCGFHESDELQQKLNFAVPPEDREAKCGEYRWARRNVRTATLFETCHTGLACWLANNFGKNAHNKTVPAWAFGLPCGDREALLNGYVSADGHDTGRQIQTSTVSKRLAIGIRMLAQSLGYRTSVTHREARACSTIEGREVNECAQYHVRWLKNPQREDSYASDGVEYQRVTSVSAHRQAIIVYNISVEEDESYIADSIVVHNCTHHSRARGGKPKNKQSRASAFDIIWWLESLYVQNVLIENVQEWKDWGPLRHKRHKKTGELCFDKKTGEPIWEVDPKFKGFYFRMFCDTLRELGYEVEFRTLCAANYGDPTTRERLFLMATRNGTAQWPVPSHRPANLVDQFPGTHPWVPVKAILDTELKGESIYSRKAHGKKDLVSNTLTRIFAGMRKNARIPILVREGDRVRLVGGKEKWPESDLLDPFLVVMRNKCTSVSLDDPCPTLCTSNHVCLASPFLVNTHHSTEGDDRRCYSLDRPLVTQTAKSGLGLVETFLVPNFGERDNQAPRTHSVQLPLPTVTSHGSGGVVESFLVTPYGPSGSQGDQSLSAPLPTLLAENHTGVVDSFLYYGYGGKDSASLSDPCPTVCASWEHLGVIDSFLLRYNGAKTSTDHRIQSVDEPISTIDTSNRLALCQFVVSYYGNGECTLSIADPLDTVTTKDRFALIELQVVPMDGGQAFEGRIVGWLDILYRMLEPHELALAHSFPPHYVFDGNKADKVRQIGNSWPIKTGTALCLALLTRPNGRRRGFGAGAARPSHRQFIRRVNKMLDLPMETLAPDLFTAKEALHA